MNMYPVASPDAVGYAAYFCSRRPVLAPSYILRRLGGSMLIIGSAAGVVAMGIEKISIYMVSEADIMDGTSRIYCRNSCYMVRNIYHFNISITLKKL